MEKLNKIQRVSKPAASSIPTIQADISNSKYVDHNSVVLEGRPLTPAASSIPLGQADVTRSKYVDHNSMILKGRPLAPAVSSIPTIQADISNSKYTDSNLMSLKGRPLAPAASSIPTIQADVTRSKYVDHNSMILKGRPLAPAVSSIPTIQADISNSKYTDPNLMSLKGRPLAPAASSIPTIQTDISNSKYTDPNLMSLKGRPLAPAASSIPTIQADVTRSKYVDHNSVVLKGRPLAPAASSIPTIQTDVSNSKYVDHNSVVLEGRPLTPAASSIPLGQADVTRSKYVDHNSMILKGRPLAPAVSSIPTIQVNVTRSKYVDHNSMILKGRPLAPAASSIPTIQTKLPHSQFEDLQSMLLERKLSKPTSLLLPPSKILTTAGSTSIKRQIVDSTKDSPLKLKRLTYAAAMDTSTRPFINNNNESTIHKTFQLNKDVFSNSKLVFPTAKAENLRSTDGFSTAVNEVLFPSDDFPTVEFEKSKETDEVSKKKVSEIDRGAVSETSDSTVMRLKTSSSIEQKKGFIDVSSTLKNGYLQTGSIVRRLNAALDANQSLSVKLALLSKKNQADEKKLQELIDEKKISDEKVVSLETKLSACELIIAALRKDILEKQHLARQLLKKKEYSVPYQNLQKYRREARLETLVNSVKEIRGLQSDDVSEQDADRMIVNDLFQKMEIDSPIVCRTVDPEDDFRTFLSNGVTWTQRELIRKKLDELGFNILVSNSRLFRWKKEFSASYENFYKTDLVKVDDENIPIIQVKDVKSLLEKILQKLKSENKLSSHPNFGGKIWISVVIDKGSDFTKIILLISNSQKPNSMKDGLILGVYEGDEDHETLRVCLKDLANQINDLKTVTVDSVVYDVETHITGDMKTMVALAGIQSCSSTYFCIFCHYFKTKAKDCFFGQHGKERTIESLIENAKKYLLKTIVSEKERLKAAQESFSSVFLPLFLIILMNFVPSALHLFLGIGNYLLKSLEAECIRIDLGNIEIDASGCNNKNDMVKLKTLLTTERKSLTIVQKETETEGKILESLKIMEQTLANPPTQKQSARIAQNSDKCHSKTCYLSNSALYRQKIPKSDKLNCSLCNHWFHATCQLYLSTCHIVTVKKNGFICDRCQPPRSSTIQRLDSKLNDNDEEKKKIGEKINEIDQKLQDFDKIFETGSDSCYSRLQEAIKKCGAWKSAYNQELNGNHLRKLFTELGIEKLFGVLHFPLNKKLMSIKELMSLLQNIQSYSCARFLEEDEIDDLEMSTKTFIDVFAINFPDASVFPKLHWLGSHLLPFVRRKKTWGLLSEQPIEHFHAEWNKAQTRFSHITNTQEKMRKIVAFLNCKHFV